MNLEHDTVLPQANEDLQDWVMERYRAVTTFTAVHGANTINLKIGEGMLACVMYHDHGQIYIVPLLFPLPSPPALYHHYPKCKSTRLCKN